MLLNANLCTVESRFLEPSVSRTSRYLEPNLVSLGFTSLELYNFTPDFSNPRFIETPDNSNQFFFSWDKLTLDNSNLRTFRNDLVRMSIWKSTTKTLKVKINENVIELKEDRSLFARMCVVAKSRPEIDLKDRYDVSLSLKSATRLARQGAQVPVYYIRSPMILTSAKAL